MSYNLQSAHTQSRQLPSDENALREGGNWDQLQQSLSRADIKPEADSDELTT